MIYLKRLIYTFIVLLIILLTFSLFSYAAEYDTLKVGLYYGSSAQSSVTINVATGVSLGYFDGTQHCETGVLYGTDFTVSADSETTMLINGTQDVETGGSNLSLMPIEGNIKINGKEYRGSALFTNASATTLNVMNLVGLEQYLCGVIPSEVPASWNEEALKAQAICARGFAISNFNKHASSGFNVCATTNCQVYGGVASEKASTNKAVNDTAGQVLSYDGKIIESLFYSSSGGHTANVKNVWGSSLPYLSGVPDPYEPEDVPRHSWSATLTNEEISEIFKNNGNDIGTLISLTATTDETGRTYRLTAEGTNGTHTLTRQSTYSPFYSKGVLSQKYVLSPNSTGARTLYALSKKGKGVLSAKTAIDSKGNKISLSGDFDIISENGKETYDCGDITSYTFVGGGWGHGVGMSQYGAMGMADAGFTYDEIVYHYFPGTELISLY